MSLNQKFASLIAAYSTSVLKPELAAAAHTHLDALLALFAESKLVPLKPVQQVETKSDTSLYIAPMDRSFLGRMVTQIVAALPNWNCTVLEPQAALQTPGIVVVLHNCTDRRYESINIENARRLYKGSKICHFFIRNDCGYVDYKSPQADEIRVDGAYTIDAWAGLIFTDSSTNGLQSLAEKLELYRSAPAVAIGGPAAVASAPAVAVSVAVWSGAELDQKQQKLISDTFAEAKITSKVAFYHGDKKVDGNYVVHLGSLGGRCLETEVAIEVLAKYPGKKALYVVRCTNPTEVATVRVPASVMASVVLAQSKLDGVKLLLEKPGVQAVAAALANLMAL